MDVDGSLPDATRLTGICNHGQKICRNMLEMVRLSRHDNNEFQWSKIEHIEKIESKRSLGICNMSGDVPMHMILTVMHIAQDRTIGRLTPVKDVSIHHDGTDDINKHHHLHTSGMHL